MSFLSPYRIFSFAVGIYFSFQGFDSVKLSNGGKI
jgi:hypothetical protein